MDLFGICRTLWRNKWLTLPLAAATILGAVYMAAFTKPSWNATSTYVVVPPPTAASPSAVAKDPGLATANPANPLSRFNDPTVVVAIIVSDVTSDQSRLTLEASGADKNYNVAPSTLGGPTLQVTGTGTSAAASLRTRALVQDAIASHLRQIQAAQGVNPYYMYQVLQIGTTNPTLQVSGRLRSLVAVIALGLILIFIAVSVGDALRFRRSTTRGRSGRAVNEPVAMDFADDAADDRMDSHHHRTRKTSTSHDDAELFSDEEMSWVAARSEDRS